MSLHPIYLIYGDEQLLVRQRCAEIVSQGIDGGSAAFNHTIGSAAEGSVPALLLQAQTLPMMAARRVVEIRELEGSTVESQDALLAYAADPCPTAVVVLSCQSLPKASGGVNRGVRLRNAIKKTGEVVRFESSKTDPVAYARRRAQELGCALERRAAQLLVDLVGSDLGRVEGEIGKLVAFVGGKGAIEVSAVDEVCSLLAEADVWSLTDAIVGRRAGEAFGVVHRLLEEGEAPLKILGLIDWQLRQLLRLQDALDAGESPFQSGVRMPRFKMDACVRALRSRPLRADAVLGQLASVSRDMRGHAAGSRHVLEAFVLRLVASEPTA